MLAGDVVRTIEPAILPMLVAVRLVRGIEMMSTTVLFGIANPERISFAVAMSRRYWCRYPQQRRDRCD
jgi:hypothetical protein